MPAISRREGAMCREHYGYVYRTGGEPADFIPMIFRKSSAEPPVIRPPRPPRANPRRDRCTCACGERPHHTRAIYCHAHAVEAKGAGVEWELTGLCVVTACEKKCRKKDGLCARHGVRRDRYGIELNVAIRLFSGELPCESCGTVAKLHIDHDHSCCVGKKDTCGQCVRGFLCMDCNIALGFLQDSPHRIGGLLAYMERALLRDGALVH